MNDITIIGGGPTGCFTASKLAEKGFEVTILEEHAEIGQPMCCAGILGARGLKEIGLDPERLALSELQGAVFHTPAGDSISLSRDKTEAYVIDRANFDREMAEKSVRAGANLHLKSKCIDISAKEDAVSVRTRNLGSGDTKEIKSRLIIGADGPNSFVGRELGLIKNYEFLNCAQIEAMADINENTAELYFDNNYSPGFFSWIIPAGESFRVGLGSLDGGSAQKLMRFIKKHPIASKKIMNKNFSITTGLIPEPKSRKIYDDRVLLVGDAAGQVKPITGGGLYMGLSCADMAVNVISKALENEPTEEELSEYDDLVNQKFGNEFEFGMKAQKIFREMSNEEISEVLNLLSKPGIRELVLENAEFDHHSKLFKALIERGPNLVTSVGVRKFMKYVNKLVGS
ncbi:MAG: NAD(P)/FAD-dependent oxidoreductase [Hadesarchaea archaeon]|nr:NAD(P)/FAD-dependent oxidoreductase [Hadesarchaea archaeon]